MADSGFYGAAMRRKKRPRDRQAYRDKDLSRESYGARTDFASREHSYLESRDKQNSIPHTLLKQPMILAKPDSCVTSRQRLHSSSPVADGTKLTKTLVNSTASIGTTNSDKFHGHREQKPFPGKLNVQNAGTVPKNMKVTSGHTGSPDSLSAKLTKENSSNTKPVKILDGFLHWTDCGIDALEDQTHFLVVGVLGEQGVGKSTVMSHLAGSGSNHAKLIFPSQTRDVMEQAGNMTVGVDMFVTEERTIFLDSQPILSPSLLYQCIYNDRKMSAEYSGPAVGIEMQSLQLATFFFTVCHVVIVVQDWFTDMKLYNFLQCAEMLKLTSPTHSADSVSSESEFEEFHPHLIFVQNKAGHDQFDPTYLNSMTETISNVLAQSKLLYKNSISLTNSGMLPNLALSVPPPNEVNIFVIPMFSTKEPEKRDAHQEDGHFHILPKYTSTPNAEHAFRIFRNMILSIRRLRLTRQPLTEKNWFYYAAKTWEAIKKSQMMAEFNRLLV